jgi:hypothetical protein
MNLLAQAVDRGVDVAPFAVGGGMLLVILVLGIIGLGIWLWALIDAIQNPALDPTMRIVWILVIVFTQWLGAVIYLLVGRSRRVVT